MIDDAELMDVVHEVANLMEIEELRFKIMDSTEERVDFYINYDRMFGEPTHGYLCNWIKRVRSGKIPLSVSMRRRLENAGIRCTRVRFIAEDKELFLALDDRSRAEFYIKLQESGNALPSYAKVWMKLVQSGQITIGKKAQQILFGF